MKFQSSVVAALLSIVMISACAESNTGNKMKTVADLNQNKAKLAGKTIQAQGEVVKVNNGIKGHSFVHVQDGTGTADSNKIIVRSKQTANVGDKVTISGVVAVDRDMGAGYVYPLLIDEATITPKK